MDSWMAYHDVFLRYLGDNKFYDQFIFKLYFLKREKDEDITQFNIIFLKFYLSMPIEIKPLEFIARIIYTAVLGYYKPTPYLG